METTCTSSKSCTLTACCVLLHYRWTGSNTNPGNNDGQGRTGSDHSNIVLLKEQNYPEGIPVPEGKKFGHYGNSYPAHLDAENMSFLGFKRSLRQNLAMLDNGKI